MNFYCTTKKCHCRGIIQFGNNKAVRCTAHNCKDRTEPSCCSCRWHDAFSWVCFNGLSERRADITDPEDNCKEWEKREDDDRKENQGTQK